MGPTQTRPRTNSLVIMGIIAPIAIAFVLAGGLAVRSMAANPVRHGMDAPATILSRSGEHAVVRFTTATGAVTTTTVAVCHHQSYTIGSTLVVRYDPKEPAHAAERDMLPGPNLALPALAMVMGIAAAAGVLLRLLPRLVRSSPPALLGARDGEEASPPWEMATAEDAAERLVSIDA